MNIYEIAKECGVSSATVSRVINGKSDVSAKTRQKIQDTMKKYGFKPQTTKSANNTVCLFIANAQSHDVMLASPYITELINGIMSELYAHHFVLSILPLLQAPQTIADFQIFCQQHRFAGAIVANISRNDKILQWDIQDLPMVFVGEHSVHENIPTVSSENQKGAYDAVSHLIQMGHRRIMHVTVDCNLRDHQERLDGYLKALEDNGIPMDPRMVFECGRFSEADFRIRITNLIRDPLNCPTAIFACDDMKVLQVVSLLKELRIKIPDDISVVGFDDYSFSCFMSPPLTTVRQPVFDIGRYAASTVLSMAKADGMASQEPVDIILPTRLVIRNSVKKLSD